MARRGRDRKLEGEAKEREVRRGSRRGGDATTIYLLVGGLVVAVLVVIIIAASGRSPREIFPQPAEGESDSPPTRGAWWGRGTDLPSGSERGSPATPPGTSRPAPPTSAPSVRPTPTSSAPESITITTPAGPVLTVKDDQGNECQIDCSEIQRHLALELVPQGAGVPPPQFLDNSVVVHVKGTVRSARMVLLGGTKEEPGTGGTVFHDVDWQPIKKLILPRSSIVKLRIHETASGPFDSGTK